MQQSDLGDYLKEIGKYALLTREEEQALARTLRSKTASARDKARARDRLTNANLKLVVSLAKRHAKSGIPLHELIAEGNVGLIKAVERFDPKRGTRFSTYAAYWIRQAIQLAVQRLKRGAHAKAEVKEESEEITPPRGRTVSLDALFALADSDSNVELEQSRVDLERVRQVIDQLGGREAEILRLRYGLTPKSTPLTLDEIGKKLGITRERVRQIEERAIRKLQRECRKTLLAGR